MCLAFSLSFFVCLSLSFDLPLRRDTIFLVTSNLALDVSRECSNMKVSRLTFDSVQINLGAIIGVRVGVERPSSSDC